MIVKWVDQKVVNVLTTSHSDTMVPTTERNRKTGEPKRNRVFFHLVDFTLVNSRAVYKLKTGSNLPLAIFQL